MTQEDAAEHVAPKYTAADIEILDGLEAVRRNPSMYVGGSNERGLHQLFKEVSDNAVDEALAGHCDRIDVVLDTNGSVSVKDNGRGIPVNFNELYNKPGVELMLTKLFVGPGGQYKTYKVSGGQYRVGVCCVNALSNWLTVTIWHDGKIYKIGFERGITAHPLTVIGDAKPGEQGTLFTWHADPRIFGEHQYNAANMEWRLRELAYLNQNLTLTFTNEHEMKPGIILETLNQKENGASEGTKQSFTRTYHYPNGLT